MARKKTDADERYNARRRAKRYVQKLQREAQALTGKARTAQDSYIQGLQRLIQQSYITRNGTEEQAKATAKAQKVFDNIITKDVRTSAQARRNAVFQRELNLGSAGLGSTLGNSAAASQAMAKVFYRATQKIWDGLPNEKRTEAILAHFGTDSLARAYGEVFKQNQNMLEAIRALERGEVNSIEEWFLNEGTTNDNEGSPDYLDFVKPIEVA